MRQDNVCAADVKAFDFQTLHPQLTMALGRTAGGGPADYNMAPAARRRPLDDTDLADGHVVGRKEARRDLS